MRKFRLLLLILLAGVGCVGCLRDGLETIALPFGKIPNAVIPQEIREQFQQYMPIYEGITPPDVTGAYLASPLQIVFTSDYQFDPGDLFAPQYFAFQDQTASGMATYSERQGSGVSEASEVYIVGSGDNFTAYFISHTTLYDDDGNLVATTTESNVASGTKTDAGISNYRYAFVMLDKYDPTGIIMAVNDFRVFEDGDGLAIRYDWAKSVLEEGLEKSVRLKKN